MQAVREIKPPDNIDDGLLGHAVLIGDLGDTRPIIFTCSHTKNIRRVYAMSN